LGSFLSPVCFPGKKKAALGYSESAEDYPYLNVLYVERTLPYRTRTRTRKRKRKRKRKKKRKKTRDHCHSAENCVEFSRAQQTYHIHARSYAARARM
jgi:hypothetical protein